MQSRPNGAWETSRQKGLLRHLRLRRADGRIYLERRGIALDGIGLVLLHRMDAPDPGIDLHDHPWWFVSIVLRGGYVEQRALCREAPDLARITRGVVERRRVGSVRVMRLDECHTIVELPKGRSWSLVIGGPRRRRWGFYLPTGYVDERTYDETVRADRRDMWAEVSVNSHATFDTAEVAGVDG